ncbi:G1/S-specific cyclin cln3 [Cichlidogyrus casuarinus]|uniref:Battenin n=1 Tax=Cichlidogyrus casuarinus TaxID=1844966 RepID=A0ABD2PN56_9PLAT
MAELKWRQLLAFWIFGISNNFIFVIMLSGAMDILKKVQLLNTPQDLHKMVPVNCTPLGTSYILVAKMVPETLFKVLAPFFIQRISFKQVFFSVGLAFSSTFVVAFARSVSFVIFGVILTSLGVGIGTVTFMSLIAFYGNENVAFYSSGTGAAGLVASFYYAGMASKFSPDLTIMITSSVPVLCFLVYMIVLPKSPVGSLPIYEVEEEQEFLLEEEDSLIENQVEPKLVLKFQLIKAMAHLMLAAALVFYFQYLINQALFEYMNFAENYLGLDLPAQYRWYQVLCAAGIFVGRSSVKLVHIRQTWIFTVLQSINFFLILLHLLYPFIPFIWVAFVLIFYEGLISGLAFVNTFHRIAIESPAPFREFTLASASAADTIGILLSAFSGILVHNALCTRLHDD